MKRDVIEIIPYQEIWQEQFKFAEQELKRALGDICLCIEHIGSTSVRHLVAKDRIDMQIGVNEISTECCELINSRLSELGYPDAYLSTDHLPPNEFDQQDWKKIYLSGVNSRWKFKANIHIRKVGAKNYNYALLFRDYLRNHPESAKAYARVKQSLAKHTRHDRDTYCEIKDPVCDLIMVNARSWKESQRC